MMRSMTPLNFLNCLHFQFEVNELAWNKEGDLFFLTNGQGCVHVYNYPEMELQHVLQVVI